MRKTKMVCTIGPASRDPVVLRRLIRAGMDCARLNFSHETPEVHGRTLRALREAAEAESREVAALQDLPGPKIRTGRGETIELVEGSELVILPGVDVTEPGRIGCSYSELGRELRAGGRVLLSDGFLELEVLESRPEEVRCRVVRGGDLRARQGINLPGAELSARSPTAEDIEYLRWGLDAGVDYIALSFVKTADDVKRARDAAGARARDVRIVAKIERPEAVRDIDNILDAADGIMVARGDLGVELPPERVPPSQREIVRRANAADKPVIVATQMLESMTVHLRPTRAEVSDVAHAIWDGTDAVMLSGETASGRHPVEAASLMARIAEEADLDLERQTCAPPRGGHTGQQDVVGMAASLLARELSAAAIAAVTLSGETARYVSMARPQCPVLGLSPSSQARRRMALYRGVIPMAVEKILDAETLASEARRAARETGLAKGGDLVVLVYGEPVGSGVRANTVRLAWVE